MNQLGEDYGEKNVQPESHDADDVIGLGAGG